MRDGGKGDKQRPLGVPEEQFNANWDTIFKNPNTMIKINENTSVIFDEANHLEPIPFAGMVDTEDKNEPQS